MQYNQIPAVIGLLTITHVKTGKYYMVCSKDLRASAAVCNGQCTLGTYQNPKLQQLYNQDPILDYQYTETSTTDEANSLRQDIQAKDFGIGNCLNMQNGQTLSGVWSLRHTPSGKVMIGKNTNLVKHQRTVMHNLKDGVCKNRAFQSIYNADPVHGNYTFSFAVTSDPTEQDNVYKTWINESMANGSLVTVRKGPVTKSVGPNGKACGWYIISFTKYGWFYVGSAIDVNSRIRQHQHFFSKGTNTCKQLQAAYNQDSNIDIKVTFTDTLEEAKRVVSDYLALQRGNQLNLNNLDDTKSNVHHTLPEWQSVVVDAAVKYVPSEVTKAKRSESMRNSWANPELRANRSGGNNPKAVAVKMFGKRYPTVADAIRTGTLSEFMVRKRLKDPNDLEIVYCTD